MTIAQQTQESLPALQPKKVTVLGATGSVGQSTLDLIAHDPESFSLEAITAHRSVEALAAQAWKWRPKLAVIGDVRFYGALKDALSGSGVDVAAGERALIEAAERPADFVMSAIVGAAGLAPTLAAARRGAAIGLANKESLVCAGPLLIREVVRAGATLLPVDSEHNAIFQVLDPSQRESLDRIVLTASGGPFRERDPQTLAQVTPEEAVAHPTWSMGPKISVDSATMMNKGLEIIEAHHLFAVPEDRIDVLIHPQSIIHSMVSYRDGAVLAELGVPDMRGPIAHALAWPRRMETPVKKLNLAEIGCLTFEAPDDERFPALSVAREALRQGGGAPAVLNAANEVAVAAFLERRITFTDIIAIVSDSLARVVRNSFSSLEDLEQLDAQSRRVAGDLADKRAIGP